MAEVTQLLAEIEKGDPRATNQLLPLVYEELRKLAAEKMAKEQPGQTLQATALVHEAYLRLVPNGGREPPESPRWNSRGHFFAAAAEAMRRILIDRARRKASAKAGGEWRRVDLEEIQPAIPGPRLDLLALNAALEELEKIDARAAVVVKLRFFTGLTTQDVANALGVSLATAENDWAYAKSYLRLQLTDSDSRA